MDISPLQSRDYINIALDDADLVISVGYDLVEYAPSFWNHDRSTRIIHIDFEPAEIDSHYPRLRTARRRVRGARVATPPCAPRWVACAVTGGCGAGRPASP